MSLPSDAELDLLLARCQHDHLIDAFEKRDDDVIIRLGYARHQLSREMAARFLEGILKYGSDLHTVATLFAYATRPHGTANLN
jgi:hypothetical protein